MCVLANVINGLFTSGLQVSVSFLSHLLIPDDLHRVSLRQRTPSSGVNLNVET